MPTIYRVIYVPTKTKSIYSIKRRLADRFYTKVLKVKKGHRCEKCKTQHEEKSKGLHVSHYFSRKREATRFNPDNTDLLCLACHMFFTHHRGEYTKYKRRKLGTEGYAALCYEAQKPNDPASIEATDRKRLTEFRKFLADSGQETAAHFPG